MVDSIGSKTVTVGDPRIAAVTRVATAKAATTSTTAQAQTPAATTLAKEMAAKPPVDMDRVRQIKAAIADGTFPLNPAKVADQLIALRYEWMTDDKA